MISLIGLRDEVFERIDAGVTIDGKQFSMEPDMVFGWRPRQTIVAPIPLNYINHPLDRILKHLLNSSPEAIVYLGFQPDDSFELHEKFSSPDSYQVCILNAVREKWLKMKEVEGKAKVRVDKYDQASRPYYGMNPVAPCQFNFDSTFESGNLDAVVQAGESEFDCFIRVDTNTRGHLQWFYFSVENKGDYQISLFNICNFTKAKSLYNKVFNWFLLRE